MKRNTGYYKMYSKFGLEGYYVPVRNTFNNSIEREFLPVEARDMYEQKFGEKVASDREFIDWYTKNVVNFQ